MPENIDYTQAVATLAASLNLRQPPVAICFTDIVPSGVTPHEGRVPAGCRFWQDAARRSFVTSAEHHDLCAIGVYTHNLQPSVGQQIDLNDALQVLGSMEYVRQEDLHAIPVLQWRPKHVVYAPLAETPLPPAVVVLFVDAGEALILSEATQQVENQNPPAMGRPACGVVPQVMNTGRAALSLGCCGARAYLDVLTPEVAIFAIPGAKLDQYVRRIEILARANTMLAKFHGMRRCEIAAGSKPTVKDSLVALGIG